MVKAGQRVQLAEDALRGGSAATWELRPCFPCRRGQVTALCHCRLKTFLTHANVVTRFLSACEAISCQFLICTHLIRRGYMAGYSEARKLVLKLKPKKLCILKKYFLLYFVININLSTSTIFTF